MDHGMVMTRSPSTGREIATGIACDWVTFNSLSTDGPDRLRCPSCGSEHHWSVADAWLAPIAITSSAAQANGKQSA